MTADPIPDDDGASESEPPFLSIYVASTRKHIDRLRSALDAIRPPGRGTPSETLNQAEGEAFETLLRGFHSLHGNSSFVKGCPITPLARAGEMAIKAARSGRLDPRRLMAPLSAALERIEARADAYENQGKAGPSDPREREVVAALVALTPAPDPERRASGGAGAARYTYAGHDVTAILDILAGQDGPDGGHDREASLASAKAELKRRATQAGDDDLRKVLEEDGAAGVLLRMLAQRVERGDNGG
jgi:chemotaxis protein histidine kinase CheA